MRDFCGKGLRLGFFCDGDDEKRIVYGLQVVNDENGDVIRGEL